MTVNNRQASGFVFTGWHMLGVMVLFFGTIITVNMIMAWNAVTSWSGLVVPNTYVASQQFNAKAEAAKARAATGIKGRLVVDEKSVRYEVFHAESGPVETDSLTLHFRRPVGEHQNFDMELKPVSSGVFTAAHDMLPGQWIVEVTAVRDGRIIVHEGTRIAVIRGRL
ncbi:cation transporter [Rhizobium rhizogenes]|uniref:Cation transporter n=1 Tax=Rhizobium rhizogenes TaxID=359 RepID=A0AA88JSF1_RHIRH|nr:FixH family protein [Rhizobium rhizogenes]KAA3504113.1 cation transporter [Rhizobium rhizogenes]